MSPVTLYSIIGLALAFLLSAGANLYQLQSSKAAAAACESARLTVERDFATGTAAAEKERANQIAEIALDSSADEAKRIELFEEATKRIAAAANGYARASKSAPLPEGCRASADRVQAVNDERGHAQ